jgi:hypothetical protein
VVLWLIGHVSLLALLIVAAILLIVAAPAGAYTRRGWY